MNTNDVNVRRYGTEEQIPKSLDDLITEVDADVRSYSRKK